MMQLTAPLVTVDFEQTLVSDVSHNHFDIGYTMEGLLLRVVYEQELSFKRVGTEHGLKSFFMS